MFRLTLFGPFSLTDSSGVEVALTSRKAKALLAYLARTPGQPRSRPEILALLWSDRQEAQGRASLRQVLSGLRKEAGDDLLRIDRDSVALNPDAVDLAPDNGGEFLSGFHLNDPVFEDWLRDERLRLEDAPHTAGSPAPPATEKPTIAVLPFENLSNDPDQQYFADGITEDIITVLSRSRALWVVSRNSSFAYSRQQPDLKDAGSSLGVRYVVEGSVRKVGGRIRVASQLIDVDSGASIWADRYDRYLEDIFAVQDEVVASLVAKLGLSLNDLATSRAKTRPTDSLSAYDLLLRARYAWWRGNDAEAFAFTRKSVAADPVYAVAHAYFSLQHAYQFYSRTFDLSKEDLAEKCRFHAESALALDDTDPIVHAYASMAFGFSPLAAKERGLKHIKIAVSLNPNDCELMLLHAWHLAFAGHQKNALELLERNAKLNPLGGYMLSECYADLYYMMGEYEKALASYADQADAPHQAIAVFIACNAQLGRVEAMNECLAKLERTKPEHFDLTEFAHAQIMTCVRDEDKENWRRGFRLAGAEV